MNEFVSRLLGPDGPEIGCDECFERLDVYVEADDPEAAVPGMAAHLAGCPACREEYESLKQLVEQDS